MGTVNSVIRRMCISPHDDSA